MSQQLFLVLVVVSTVSFLSSTSELAILSAHGLPFQVADLRITEPLLLLVYGLSLSEIFGISRIWSFVRNHDRAN